MKLATLRALVKEYKAKIAKLDIIAQQNIVSVVLEFTRIGMTNN